MSDPTVEAVTADELKNALPPAVKRSASQELLDKIHGLAEDEEMARTMRDNMISYTSVLADGKYKIEDYLHAVTYVSYKLMGDFNKDAYKKTFPERYDRLVQSGATEKKISAYVAGYNNGQLVNQILEQTLIPTHVLNQATYQEAINVQAGIMNDTTVSPKVRSDAADSIMNHLKRPEKQKVELDLGINEDKSGLADLKATISDLAKTQREMIGQGASTRDVAHQDIASTARDVTPDNEGDTT